MKQEYKIVKDGFEVFYFAHSLKSAYEWAIESFNRCIESKKYSKVSLYGLNRSQFGEKWKLLNEHRK